MHPRCGFASPSSTKERTKVCRRQRSPKLSSRPSDLETKIAARWPLRKSSCQRPRNYSSASLRIGATIVIADRFKWSLPRKAGGCDRCVYIIALPDQERSYPNIDTRAFTAPFSSQSLQVWRDATCLPQRQWTASRQHGLVHTIY